MRRDPRNLGKFYKKRGKEKERREGKKRNPNLRLKKGEIGRNRQRPDLET